MRRITDRYMFKSEAEAKEYGEQFCRSWNGPYDGRATVRPDATLRPPFTHEVEVTRWNSCN